MSRSIKKANKQIFSRLMDFVRQNDTEARASESDLSKERRIETDDNEQLWLKNSKILNKRQILPRLKTALVEFDDKKYFIVIGWIDAASFEDLLLPIDLNAGIVTAILCELEVQIRQDLDYNEIINNIIPQYKKIRGYSVYDFDTVMAYFDPILVYEISQNLPFALSNLDRISCLYISQNKNKLTLPFSEETILTLQRLFLEGADKIPYENLLQSLNSVYWKYVFLDIYRCIEQFFPIQNLTSLRQRLSLSISLFDLSKHLEENIGWKAKEDESIRILFDNIIDNAKRLLEEVKNSRSQSQSDSLYRWFYNLRNSIVHYRPSMKQPDFSDENWDKLIRGTLLAIQHWYKLYDNEL